MAHSENAPQCRLSHSSSVPSRRSARPPRSTSTPQTTPHFCFVPSRRCSLAPSLSANGRYVVYLSTQLGSRAVRARDLTSGKTITLVASASLLFNPRISGDGATVAYCDGGGNIFSVPRGGGEVASLCAGCGTTMAVSAEGKRISYEPGQSEDLTWYDVDRKARVIAAQRPEGSVLTDGRFAAM